MSSKSHSLNLWDQTDSTKLDIDVSTDKVLLTTTGSQYVEITPALKLIDSVDGDIASVSTALHTLTSSVATVQTNLTAYQNANNTSLATLNSTVVANKAITDANHIADAASRVALETTLQNNIDAEESARIASDSIHTSAIAAETTARNSAVSTLTTGLAVETARIDTILNGSDVNLDQFAEVVANYSSLNTSALAQIASLNTALVALTSRVDDLTSP
tara:strand:+ start:276 stop:929 length:654 start_codon:yes stop_codon:yes gene_type:complete